MATDKNGKLTFEMKSAGDAWMQHVENQHNANAVTPAWADTTPSNDAVQKQIADLNKKVDAVSSNIPGQDVNQNDVKKGDGVNQIDKWRQEFRDKQNNPDKDKVKEKTKDKEPGISR